MKKVYTTVLIIGALAALFVGWWLYSAQKQKNKTEPPLPALVDKRPSEPTTKSTSNAFNKQLYSVDQPGSLWWIVNKKRPLTKGYKPEQLTVPNVTLRLGSSSEQMRLDARAAEALPQLFNAAKSAGYSLTLASGYRSESYQTQLYNSYVAKDGQAAADRYSAKPGTSEHQTGLSLDICISNTSCNLDQSFGATEAGKWVAQHAHEYGFVVRYLNGKEAITGYEYEPWHLRYVGKDLATQLFDSGQTMEEFFGINT